MTSNSASKSGLTEKTAVTLTHGRYLIVPSHQPGSAPLFVGFHGYAEDAETQLARLQSVPGSDGCHCVSIQGLHRFYQRRANQVVASWMTSQHRELAIADNISYVSTCLAAVASEFSVLPGVVFAGFSQGVAMAFRAAAHSSFPVSGVVAVGGDIPPDISDTTLAGFPAVIIARGNVDNLYPATKFMDDQNRLQSAGTKFQCVTFEGGHEWSGAVCEAASHLLRR